MVAVVSSVDDIGSDIISDVNVQEVGQEKFMIALFSFLRRVNGTWMSERVPSFVLRVVRERGN